MFRSPIVILAAVCTLTLAACGDDGGGGSADEFCSNLAASQSIDVEGADDPTAAIAALRDLQGSAPDAIKDDLRLIIDALAALTDLDFTNTSEEDIAALEEQFADLEDASARLETWAQENCTELPADFFQS